MTGSDKSAVEHTAVECISNSGICFDTTTITIMHSLVTCKLTLGRLNLIYIVYKVSVCTAHKTLCFHYTTLLNLCRTTGTVYSKNHTKCMNGQHSKFWINNLVKMRKVTARLSRVRQACPLWLAGTRTWETTTVSKHLHSGREHTTWRPHSH